MKTLKFVVILTPEQVTAAEYALKNDIRTMEESFSRLSEEEQKEPDSRRWIVAAIEAVAALHGAKVQ